MTTAPHWDLRRRDFHPQVQQLASLHLPRTPSPFAAASVTLLLHCQGGSKTDRRFGSLSDRRAQLQTGRYIVPLWMSDGSSTEFGPGNLGHRPSVVAGVYSDDHGATWQRADILCRHGQGDVVNPSEALPLELSDGGVLFNIRTESLRHRRYVSISPDGVTGWSEPETDDDLLEPVCMASILRVDDGSVLFVNCDVLEHELTSPDQVAHDRKRLTVKRSTDDCATWTASRVIEPGQSGYSDLTQNQEHLVCCLYEDQAIGREDDTKYVTCARFDVGWILEGEDG